MSRKKNMLLVTAGILAGVTMTGPAAHAAAVAALDAVVRRLETGAASMDLIVKRITS